MKRPAYFLLAIIMLNISCNNIFKDSLSGKTLYVLDVEKITYSGIAAIREVNEYQFNFINSTDVTLRTIAVYGTNNPIEKNSDIKNFKYSYENGVLIISNLIPATKLTKNGDEYLCEDSSILFNNSITTLPYQEKSNRLKKEIGDYPGNFEKDIVKKETIFLHVD